MNSSHRKAAESPHIQIQVMHVPNMHPTRTKAKKYKRTKNDRFPLFEVTQW